MQPLQLSPLGECAVTLHVGQHAAGLARHLGACGLPGLEDVVPAFDTVAVYYDPEQWQPRLLEEAVELFTEDGASEGRLHRIPVCYEMGADWPEVTRRTGLSRELFISLHCGPRYTCQAIGFCPGFPYLGWLPPGLAKLPRRPSPRLSVEPGSVAVAGRMTAVYPLERPGGWWLVGRTPLTLVDPASDYYPVRVGDGVVFERVDEKQFEQMSGNRL